MLPPKHKSSLGSRNFLVSRGTAALEVAAQAPVRTCPADPDSASGDGDLLDTIRPMARRHDPLADLEVPRLLDEGEFEVGSDVRGHEICLVLQPVSLGLGAVVSTDGEAP